MIGQSAERRERAERTQYLLSSIEPGDDARVAIAMTIDDLAAKFDNLEQKMDQRFESLEQKMDQGFNDSKTRDERLEGLMTFGLEARDILRDEMHRRFDEADRKHDEQITLLKDAVQRSA